VHCITATVRPIFFSGAGMTKKLVTLDLKKRLDEIDDAVVGDVRGAYYDSRLRIEMGMWEKGEAIGVFRGVKNLSWYRLEKETGRRHQNLKGWHDLYEKYPQRELYLPIAEKRAAEWTQKALSSPSWQPMLSSASHEWYTPEQYLEAVRGVLGGIDLDPASCAEANKTVMAETYYDANQDGLSQPWRGRIFLNPPYGSAGPPFIERLISELKSGNVTEAVVLVNSHATETSWFQPLFGGVLCFTDHRIDFVSPTGEAQCGSTHGSCFVYFGDNEKDFIRIFRNFGYVVKQCP